MYSGSFLVRCLSRVLRTLFRPTVSSRPVRARRTKLSLEELETRNVLSPVVQLPVGSGSYQVLFESGDVVVQQVDGAQLYRAPLANATGLTIEGTAAAETVAIAFSTGLSAGNPFSLNVVGGGGADAVTVNCAAGANNAVLQATGLSTVNGPGYSLALSNFPSLSVQGNGGNDTAQLDDTPGNDLAEITPSYASLQNTQSGINEVAVGFQKVTAQSTQGGNDAVWLYGTSGNDVGVMTPSYSYMENSSGGIYALAMDFTTATAIADAGGTDSVWLYDTPGNDVSVMTPTYANMQNDMGTVYATAVGFSTVTAVADSGGADTVSLSGSSGNNSLLYSPTSGSLDSSGQVNQFYGFQDVDVAGSSEQNSVTPQDSRLDESAPLQSAGASGQAPAIPVNRWSVEELLPRGLSSTGGQDSATLLAGPNTNVYVGAGTTGRLKSLTGNYVLNISDFNHVNLSGVASGLNVITLTNPAYFISSTGFVSSSTFTNQPLTRAQSLPLEKQLAEEVDPALATTTDPTTLAILLRNDVQHDITLGPNTTEWTSVDAYERYVQAVLTEQQPLICGGMQMLYTDLLDAFGLQARYVGLFGATPAIGTHASVEVLLNNQWVVMDPTFNVSFIGANGQRLSFADIQAGVPFTVSNDGMTSSPQLVIQNYPITIQQFCYRITYPPTVTN